MSRWRRLLPLMSAAWMTITAPAANVLAQPGQPEAPAGPPAVSQETAQLWADYIHTVKIARYDLAGGYARLLLNAVDDAQLLQIVESGPYTEEQWRSAFDRAMKDETLREVTEDLARRIQAARVTLARDHDRIAKDIELLAGTLCERQNAIERLRAAGQFAAPQMLQVLLDPAKTKLHPHVESAMIQIGRPLVYPLSVALVELEPVQAGTVTRILGQIGYPFALPYIHEVLERPATDPATQRILQVAHDRLAQNAKLPQGVTAAELYLTLGRNYYDAGSIGAQPQGYDLETKRGIVWRYPRGGPLLAVEVPTSIFSDAMAMRTAQRALALDPRMDPALSIWLGANLRRENRLLPDEKDPLGPPRDGMFYAAIAGPLRLHDVLDRALNDNDAALALDAIAGLRGTAGTETLINRRGAVQPLLRALTYPDRNVRFNAAFVMTQTRPVDSFPGSDSVVFTLAEAVRQSDLRQALAIADDQSKLNALISTLEGQGYTVLSGRSLQDLTLTLAAGAPADVVVADLRPAELDALHDQMRQDYRLASAPLVALVTEEERQSAALRFREDRHVHLTGSEGQAASLPTAIEQAITTTAGQPIDAKEAAGYASTALMLLREVSLANSPVYHVAEAEPALIDALSDPRNEIVEQAGRVLELVNSQAAQLAIAQAALDQRRPTNVRIALLDSLAESARHFGNKLGEIQVDQVLALVKSAKGEEALAAARAHGALTLPTSNAVELIVAGE